MSQTPESTISFRNSSWIPMVRGYLLAVLLVAAATLFTRQYLPILGEISPLFFAAVMLSTWFGGLGTGLLATVLTAFSSAYFFYNFPRGTEGFGWDDLVRMSIFLSIALLISFLLNKRRRAERDLRIANDNLELRVIQRTRELETSNRLVLEISENEQRRLGHDLHDGLGQELTGLAFLSQNAARTLAQKSIPEAAEVQRICSVINSAIEKTRDLAKGLSPVEWGPDGLSAALQNLATRVRESFGIPCVFHRGRAVRVESHTAALHLYRIAQEALSNAARHSNATEIHISIDETNQVITLSIEDNGRGIGKLDPTIKGMGLHLMPYRARMIGGTFEAHPLPGGGTRVRCIYRPSTDPEATAVSSASAEI